MSFLPVGRPIKVLFDDIFKTFLRQIKLQTVLNFKT